MDSKTGDFFTKIKNNITTLSSKYMGLIVILVIAIIIIGITYFISFNVRSNSKITEITNKYDATIEYQTDYCSDNLIDYKLKDYHVLSSTNSLMTGLEKYDYINTTMLETIMYYGTRYIELVVLNKDGLVDTNPVLSYGIQIGNWKTSYNVIDPADIFTFISQNAFSQQFIPNYRDPLFVFLDIKTDGNMETLDRLYDIIISTCNQFLLDDKYRNEKINLANVSVCNLMNKLIIFSNTGYEGSKLEKIVNLSTKGPYLQRIPYSQVINKYKFNWNNPICDLKSEYINFIKGYTYDYINVSDSSINLLDYGFKKGMLIKIDGASNPENNTGLNLLLIRQVTYNKIVVDTTNMFVSEKMGPTIRILAYIKQKTNTNLAEENKDKLTIVIPDYNIFPINYPPTTAWYSGCQFVSLNFQVLGKEMEQNLKFFNNAGIKLKISSLRDEADIEAEQKLTEHEILGMGSAVPLPITTQNYDIDYSFISNYMNESIFINVLMGENNNQDIRIQPHIEKTNLAKLSINYNESDTIVKVVTGLNDQQNTVSFLIENPDIPSHKKYYLGVNKNKKLVSLLAPVIPNITEFSTKERDKYYKITKEYRELTNLCSFYPINSLNTKKGFVSFGILLDDDKNTKTTQVTNSNESKLQKEIQKMAIPPPTKLMYYLKYNPEYNSNNILYYKNQPIMSKIVTIENNNGKSITVWRPVASNGFHPLCDYVNQSNSISQKIHSFVDDPWSKNIYTVMGGVAKPIDFTLVWKGVTKEMPKNKSDEQTMSIWKAVASEGFTAIGFVFQLGILKPNNSIVRCIKTSLLSQAPNNLFMTFDGILNKSYDNLVSSNLEQKALDSQFKVFDIMWNNKYIKTNNVYKQITPPSRSTVKPLSIWKLNLVDKNSFNYTKQEEETIIFDYYLPYDIFLENGNTDMTPPITFSYPTFIKNKDKYTNNELLLNPYIESSIDKEIACFKVETINIKASQTQPNPGLLNAIIDSGKTTNYLGKIVSSNRNQNGHKMCLSVPQAYWSEFYEDRFNQNTIVTKPVQLKPKPSDSNTKCKFSFGEVVPCCNQPSSPNDFEDYSKHACPNEYPKCIDYDASKHQFGKCVKTANTIVSTEDTGGTQDIKISEDLMFQQCRTEDDFGTNWVHYQDETIRLEGNTNYCLTAPYTQLVDGTYQPITDNKNNKNRVKLATCDGRVGQRFKYDSKESNISSVYNGNIQSCLYTDPSNYSQTSKCSQKNIRNRFIFKSLPEQYCFNIPFYKSSSTFYIKNSINIDILNKNMANGKYGSNVFILQKFKRQLKPRATIQIVPPNIENPLGEDFDYENFHVYVRSCILHSYNKASSNNTQCVVVMGTNKPIDNMAQINHSNKINIQPRYVNYQIYVNESQIPVKCISKTGNSNDLILINKDSEEIVLAVPIQETDNLKKGTWVLCKNGLVNQPGQNYIDADSCLFLAKIIRIISPFQYEIIFSINGTEPRPRYEKFGRPSVCEVKTVPKTELYVLRQAPIC